MPFALVFIGLVLVVTGARGTMRELGAELREDFTGSGNFTWWILSIGSLGMLGYVPELRTFSRWFMALVVIAMVIKNRGFFDQLIAAFRAGPEAPKSDPNRVSDTFLTNSSIDDAIVKGAGDAFGSAAQDAFSHVAGLITSE